MESCLQSIKEEVNDDVILDEKDPLQCVLLKSILPPTDVSPNFELVVVKNEIKTEEYSYDDRSNDDELELDDNVKPEAEILKEASQQSTSALSSKIEIKFSDKEKINRKPKGKGVFCQICSERLSKTRKEHYRERHDGYSFKCTFCCEKLFKQRKELERHVNMAKGIKPYECNDCLLNFLSSTDLKSHNYTKHSKVYNEDGTEKILECNSCSKIFKTKASLLQHLSYHTKSQINTCKICGKVFTQISNYYVHQQTHMERPICKECSKSFGTKYALQTHIRTIHRGEILVCHICAKTFTLLNNLKLHLESHAKKEEFIKKLDEEDISRPFQCDICKRKFIHKFHLNEHKKLKHLKMKVPRDEISYTCPICKKEFTLRHHLDQHSAIHNDEKKYECKICFAKFRFRPSLISHMKSKTLHVTYTCTTCGDTFVGKNNYNAHLVVHTQ